MLPAASLMGKDDFFIFQLGHNGLEKKISFSFSGVFLHPLMDSGLRFKVNIGSDLNLVFSALSCHKHC